MTGEDFASRLKALRLGRKMTQAQLAARSGVTLRALAYWEAGRHAPGSQELNGVADALQLTAEERQALVALLPAGKAAKLIQVLPAWSDIAPPPGIGDLIRALRWRKRMLPEQLAHALGVNRTTIVRWENAKTVPGEEMRLRLCDTLDALPPERAVLLVSGNAPPLWDGNAPNLEACREEAERLSRDSYAQVDPLFDMRAHLLAGTLYNLASRQPQARPILAQTYAAHARFACIRGDDAAALDYAGRSLQLIREGEKPHEGVLYRALWASGHSLAHRAPQSGPKRSLQQVTQWLPQVQIPGVRVSLLMNAAWWAQQAGSLPQARDYWGIANALTNGSHPNPHVQQSLQSTDANLLVAEGRYDEGLEVALQINSDSYVKRIMRCLFQTSVFLKAGSKSEADSHLRRAYDLIAIHQADLYRKEADGFAAQLEA